MIAMQLFREKIIFLFNIKCRYLLNEELQKSIMIILRIGIGKKGKSDSMNVERYSGVIWMLE